MKSTNSLTSRGLTLVEVLISISLLTLGGVALAVAMSSTSRVNDLAGEMNVAQQDLERMTQVLMATPWPPWDNGFPNNAGPPDTAVVTVGALRGVDVTVPYNGALNANDLLLTLRDEEIWVQYQPITAAGVTGAVGDAGNPIQVTVTVQWTSGQGTTMRRSLVTVLAN